MGSDWSGSEDRDADTDAQANSDKGLLCSGVGQNILDSYVSPLLLIESLQSHKNFDFQWAPKPTYTLSPKPNIAGAGCGFCEGAFPAS